MFTVAIKFWSGSIDLGALWSFSGSVSSHSTRRNFRLGSCYRWRLENPSVKL